VNERARVGVCPGARSAKRYVPAAVPSLIIGSSPASVRAVKNSLPARTTGDATGLKRLEAPTVSTARLPAGVPSVT